MSLIRHCILLLLNKEKNVNQSTLPSFKSPFELLHADITDIRVLPLSAVDAKYCLLFVDLFMPKVKKKRNILKKKKMFSFIVV